MSDPASHHAWVAVPPVPQPPCIVVAEDDAELRQLLADALEKQGYAVVQAANGERLISELSTGVLAKESRPYPDALVTDVRMPGFSGFDVLTLLRFVDARLPVVVITGFGGPEVRARALELGASVVLDKPFDTQELVAEVDRLVGVER